MSEAAIDEIEELAGLGRVVATVSHELKNPLAAITNTAFLLRHHAGDNEAILRQVDRIEREVAAADAIVGDLLAYARRHDPVREPVPVAGLVHEVLDVRHAPDGVDVEVDVHDALVVDVDRRMARQALLNLVGNAFEAMTAAGGELRINAASDGGAVDVEVADTGPGIAPDVAKSLFEPFVTTKASGVGLGLTVVRRFVDSHDGAIHVDTGDHGTTFHIRLPGVIG